MSHRRRIGRPLALAAGVLVILLGGAAPPPAAVEPAPPAAVTRPTSVPVRELGFLAGAWKGSMGNDTVEEIWSAPEGSGIMGCFRWIGADGVPTMLEMLAISEEADATRLRLRHYSATLVAKEESEKPLTFVLAEAGPQRAVFVAEKDTKGVARIRYEVIDGELHIEVAFVAGGGDRPERAPLRFRLRK